MKLLLVEARSGMGGSLTEELTRAGHNVVTCYDDDTDGPCRSVSRSADCPLHSHVDLAIVARRDGSQDTLLEMGGVCAERHRVPVVRIDPTTCLDSIERVRVAAAAGKDRAEAAYAVVVRAALAHMHVTVEAERCPGRVHILVRLPATSDATTRSSVADRARAAVRDYDPFVQTIDVSVTGPALEAPTPGESSVQLWPSLNPHER